MILQKLFSECVHEVQAELIDMPIEHYHLSSGRRKRRVDARAIAGIVKRFVASQQGSQDIHVVIERPMPIPDVDGWQSAALSGTPFQSLPALNHSC